MAYCAVLNSASSPVAWGDRKYAPDAEVTVCPCSHPHPSGCSPHSVAGPGWHGQEAAAAGAPHWQSAHNVRASLEASSLGSKLGPHRHQGLPDGHDAAVGHGDRLDPVEAPDHVEGVLQRELAAVEDLKERMND